MSKTCCMPYTTKPAGAVTTPGLQGSAIIHLDMHNTYFRPFETQDWIKINLARVVLREAGTQSYCLKNYIGVMLSSIYRMFGSIMGY